jgi:hypothetical protein
VQQLRIDEVDLRDLLVVDPLELMDDLLPGFAVERPPLLLVELIELWVGITAVAPAEALGGRVDRHVEVGVGVNPPAPEVGV